MTRESLNCCSSHGLSASEGSKVKSYQLRALPEGSVGPEETECGSETTLVNAWFVDPQLYPRALGFQKGYSTFQTVLNALESRDRSQTSVTTIHGM
ncbi:putative sodium-coupled neutral amino acid transporter 7 [Manis javanica]|nr:putative sodium-coupled neutral amino acid transporter 7 [Manis javanica]